MQYPREVVNEMNALSMAVFGTKSKWRKMIDMGVTEAVLEDTKHLTIVNGKEETKMTKTNVLHKDQIPLSRLRHYTVADVKEFMLTVLDRRKQVQDTIKRLEAEKKADATAKLVAGASGTAVLP